MFVSVIMPTYNEVQNIGQLIKEVADSLKEEAFEIIVVDDDSPDLTWKTVEKASYEYPMVKLIRRIDEKCLTTAIVEGIKSAKGEIIVWMDCDFSMPPCYLPALLDKIKFGYDVAVGSRYVKGGKDLRRYKFRIFASKFFNYLSKWFLKSNVIDLTSGFIAVKKEVFDKICIKGDYGDYCIKFLIDVQMQDYKTVEVPFNNMPRLKGKTKTDPDIFTFIKHGVMYIRTIFDLKQQINRADIPKYSVRS